MYIEINDNNNIFVDQFFLQKSKLADKAAKETVKYLKNNEMDFTFKASFSCSEVKLNSEKYFFNTKTKNKLLLGLASQIKSEVKSCINSIEMLPTIIKFTKVKNNYNYSGFTFLPNAHEYDLNAAYINVLRSMFISEPVYDKALRYKYNLNFNINEAIGMALLGNSITSRFRKGKIVETTYKTNEMNAVFFFVRYLVIETIRAMLASEDLRALRVAYYVDAFILKEKRALDFLKDLFYWFFLGAVEKLNKYLKKYENINIYDIFEFKNNFINTFTFKELEVVNLILEKNELRGNYQLCFTRDGKVLNYK